MAKIPIRHKKFRGQFRTSRSLEVWEHDWTHAPFFLLLFPQGGAGVKPRGGHAPLRGRGENFPKLFSRLEPLNRSSRRESALTSLWIRWSGLTSAATRFMGSFDLQLWTRIGAMNRGTVHGSAGVSSASSGFWLSTGRRDAGAPRRFMESYFVWCGYQDEPVCHTAG
jgi:hypothetical protein